jgi:soluble lytic murein transglycosylase-like protein
MKTLSFIFMGLILAAPAAAGAQSFDQLAESMDSGSAAMPVPQATPVPEAAGDLSAPPESVNFLIRTEAEHEPGAQLFSPWRSEEKSAPGADKAPKIPFLEIARAEAAANGIDLALVLAIIQKESSFDPKARSSVGAVGLMQLMPATAKWLGKKSKEELTTPAVNIKYGVKYLKFLWDEFSELPSGDISAENLNARTSQMAIAAYNAGQGNVRKYDGVPPFKETQDYVKKVTAYFTRFSDLLE